MWIFTDIGFFSVVTDDRHPKSMVQIRSRWREDLERLSKVVTFDERGIVESPDGDYPYRAFTRRSLWAGALEELALNITYRNFKGRVGTVDRERAQVYGRIWSVLWDAALNARPMRSSRGRR